MKNIQSNNETSLIRMSDTGWQEATAGNYENAGMEQAVASTGYVGRTFDNVLPSISIKSQFGKSDYDYYRQNEMTPQNPREIIEVCNRAYKKEGLVRNIVDLMAEFASKGITIVCPDKKQEKFGQEWAKYVDIPGVAERFLNLLYRMGHAPVSITYGKVPVKIEKKWSSTFGLEGDKIDLDEEPIVQISTTYKKRRMPLSYVFLNPLSIQMLAPELTAFTNKPIYGLVITHSLRNAIEKAKSVKTESIQELLKLIPQDIKKSLIAGSQIIPLNNEDFSMSYYKKDDWETYATPMLYSIIPDLVALEKLRLADKSALDGAISNIRLWTIGQLTDNPQTCIIPTKAMINKLRGILANNVGGGTMDLVWGPDLKFTESNTHVHQFLGIGKYESTYKNIYEGLGVPSSLSGGGDGGFNNSFIQMQTFVERLEYGRSVFIKFLEKELKKVQLALGYKRPFQIMFHQISLGDDNSLKQILLGLVDRNIMSVETLLTKFNCFTNVEKERIKREYKERQKDNIPDKTGPFTTITDDMKKTVLNQGGVAPSELGLNLKPKKEGEKTHLENQFNNQSKLEKLKIKNKPPVPPNGRPIGKKDSKTRKRRAVKPNIGKSSFIPLFLWANAAQKKISDIVTPHLIAEFGKKNVPSLTVKETEHLEAMKFIILSNVKPNSEITNEIIYAICTGLPIINNDIYTATQGLVYKFTSINQRQPTTEEMRQIQSSAYALYYEVDIDDTENEATEDDLEVVIN
jgi:hypothetical protein